MGYFSVFGDRGILHLQKLRAELCTVSAASEDLDRENVKLKKEIQLLNSDPRYIGKIAREELGLAREDEMVYKRVKK
jgi:cell division protein FtsB